MSTNPNKNICPEAFLYIPFSGEFRNRVTRLDEFLPVV
jgi:hypothetical protein